VLDGWQLQGVAETPLLPESAAYSIGEEGRMALNDGIGETEIF
jgi:hypothetical protein